MTTSNVLICTGAGCVASGALELSAAIKDALAKHGLADQIGVVETGCLGPCAAGPVAVIYPDGVLYQNLKAEHAERIVSEHLLKGRVVKELAAEAPADIDMPGLKDIPFEFHLGH